jgi:RNA polymerase sigma factor (sigma-70 family)
MPMDEAVRRAVLGAIPRLRAFAISLCGNVDRADDPVQETTLRAFANIHSFQPGTNISAWLFTILRNHFRSEYRKRRREDVGDLLRRRKERAISASLNYPMALRCRRAGAVHRINRGHSRVRLSPKEKPPGHRARVF